MRYPITPPQLRLAEAAIVAAVAAAGLVAPAHAGMLGPDPPLKIVSFDLAAAPGAVKPPKPEKASWRTTFGSEIRSEKRRDAPSLSIDADVVLLQGLTSIRDARQFLPAREWKLIASRQVLAGTQSTDDDGYGDAPVAAVPTTAVAIRFQKGLRIAGQDHLMDMAIPDAGTAQGLVAGTAVRLNLDARSIWVVSVALAPECAASQDNCRAVRKLTEWQNQRRLLGEATVIGGQLRPSRTDPNLALAAKRDEGRAPAADPPCSNQDIVPDPVAGSLAKPVAWRETHDFAGCLARLDLPK